MPWCPSGSVLQAIQRLLLLFSGPLLDGPPMVCSTERHVFCQPMIQLGVELRAMLLEELERELSVGRLVLFCCLVRGEMVRPSPGHTPPRAPSIIQDCSLEPSKGLKLSVRRCTKLREVLLMQARDARVLRTDLAVGLLRDVRSPPIALFQGTFLLRSLGFNAMFPHESLLHLALIQFASESFYTSHHGLMEAVQPSQRRL